MVRERDGDICRHCGVTKKELGYTPHVHHIIPVRTFDNPNDAHIMDEMIQLCNPCHQSAEAGNIELPEHPDNYGR